MMMPKARGRPKRERDENQNPTPSNTERKLRSASTPSPPKEEEDHDGDSADEEDDQQHQMNPENEKEAVDIDTLFNRINESQASYEQAKRILDTSNESLQRATENFNDSRAEMVRAKSENEAAVEELDAAVRNDTTLVIPAINNLERLNNELKEVTRQFEQAKVDHEAKRQAYITAAARCVLPSKQLASALRLYADAQLK